MKPVFFHKHKTRPLAAKSSSIQGYALLESVIGMLLLAIIGLGSTLMAARSVHSQRFANTQGAVVQQMRQTLQSAGVDQLCMDSQPTFTFNEQTLPLQTDCFYVPVQVTVQSYPQFSTVLSQPVPRIELRTAVDHEALTQLIGAGAIQIAQ